MVTKNLLFLFLVLALISPVYGMNLSVSPESPYVGDDIILKGDADAPNQILWPTVTFEKTVGVSNGIYDYNLPGIEIPSGENNFVVTSRNVKDLYVGVVLLITWSKSVTADENNIATISQSNVPSGTHNIRIFGNAADGVTSVPLTITASTKINADTQGNFSSIYSTSGIPAGNFNLTVGTITRTITLRERPNPNSGSSGGGTYPSVTTPRPTSTPVVTPTEVVISGTTNPETTSTPVETTTPISTLITNATESKSTTVPGFEIGFAFSAIALMFLLKRKIV